jgi:peptidoglycan/LPS O-acetylase OafA/YrhL
MHLALFDEAPNVAAAAAILAVLFLYHCVRDYFRNRRRRERERRAQEAAEPRHR